MEKKNGKMISVRLSQNEYKELVDHASSVGQNVSTYVKKAINSSYDHRADLKVSGPAQRKQKADILKQMLGIKELLETNRKRMPKALILDTERRLEELWEMLYL